MFFISFLSIYITFEGGKKFSFFYFSLYLVFNRSKEEQNAFWENFCLDVQHAFSFMTYTIVMNV